MTMDDISPEPMVLQLRLDPSWVFVDDIRRFVESFCAAACPGAEREEELALAAHELVQNAISYAARPGVDLRLSIDPAARRVDVSVSNAATPDQAKVLRDRLAQIASEADPLAGYLAAMHANPDGRGGLGLSRVRFEAALELEMTLDDDRVTVHARGELATRPRTFIPLAARSRGIASA